MGKKLTGESEMKYRLLSLLAGTALIASISVARADEPILLAQSQMDAITAGVKIVSVETISGANTTYNVLTGIYTFAAGEGVKTTTRFD